MATWIGILGGAPGSAERHCYKLDGRCTAVVGLMSPDQVVRLAYGFPLHALDSSCRVPTCCLPKKVRSFMPARRPPPPALSPSEAYTDRSDASDVFASEFWFDLLAAHGLLRPAQRLVVELNDHEGRAAGRLHWMLEASAGNLSSLANYYSGLFAPASLTEADSVNWIDAVRRIRALPGSAVIHLAPLNAYARWGALLLQAFRHEGYQVDTNVLFGNWYLPVPAGGFEPYWLQRPSALRNSVERGRRRLAKAGACRFELYQHATEKLDSAIAAFVQVYNQSWKPPEPNPLFIPALIRLAAREGWLRLGVLSLDGEPLAAQLWLVKDGKANIFKLAHVQGQERFSAGSVLTADLMHHVMERDQVTEVDFLSGDDAYKADWMTQRRERVGVVVFDLRQPRAWMPALRHAIRKQLRRLRDR